jgi:hypothetical protein
MGSTKIAAFAAKYGTVAEDGIARAFFAPRSSTHEDAEH